MLSSRVYSFIGIVILRLANIGVIPCSWNGDTLTFIPSERNKRLYRIHSALMLLPMCAFGSLALWFRVIEDYDQFSIAYIGTSACMLIFLVYLMMNWFEEEVILWINQLFRYFKYINHVYLPKYDVENDKRSKLFELGGILIWIATIGGFLISTLVVLRFPKLPLFWGYFVPEWLPFIVQLSLLYIPQIYTLFMYFVPIPLIIGEMYLYGFVFVPFFTENFELVDNDIQHGPMAAILAHPNELILAYRTLQFVNQGVMNIVGPFIVPAQSIITNWAIVSVYMIWKNGENMQSYSVIMIAVWAILSTIFWCFILGMGYCIVEKFRLDIEI